MAEILSAETLKATKVGKIEKAKEIINELIAAEKDQTKTSKPNRAKLTKWENAKKAYEQTETKAKALYTKFKEAGHLDLIGGKDDLNVTINEMQSALNKLDPQQREAILSEINLDQIQDVQLSNDWYEKGGGLSNLGDDIVKGGDKSVAISKAFTGVAIASFAVSGINSIFGAGTVGSLLATHIPQAVSLAGTAIKALWGFNPLGTAMLGAMVALKVIPSIARFVNKMKNKYAALTRANTMKNRLAELAEQDGPSVEFENEYTEHDEHHDNPLVKKRQQRDDERTGTPDNNGKKPSLRERLNAEKNEKKVKEIFKSATTDELIQYNQEELDICEKEIISIEQIVNSLIAQYNNGNKALEKNLTRLSQDATGISTRANTAAGNLTTILTNSEAATVDKHKLVELQSNANKKATEIKTKSDAITNACRDKIPTKQEAVIVSTRDVKEILAIVEFMADVYDTNRRNLPNITIDQQRVSVSKQAMENFELTEAEASTYFNLVHEKLGNLKEEEIPDLKAAINEAAFASSKNAIDTLTSNLENLKNKNPLPVEAMEDSITALHGTIDELKNNAGSFNEELKGKADALIKETELKIGEYKTIIDKSKSAKVIKENPPTSEKFAGMSREQKIKFALDKFKTINLSIRKYESESGKTADKGGFGLVTDKAQLPEGQEYAFKVIDEMGLDQADKEAIYELLITAVKSRSGKGAESVKTGEQSLEGNKELDEAYKKAQGLLK